MLKGSCCIGFQSILLYETQVWSGNLMMNEKIKEYVAVTSKGVFSESELGVQNGVGGSGIGCCKIGIF